MAIERSYPVLGVNRVDVIVSSARSGGTLSILTQTHPPGKAVLPADAVGRQERGPARAVAALLGSRSGDFT